MPTPCNAPFEAAGPGPLTLEKARQLFSFRGKSQVGEGVDIQLVRTHYHPHVHFKDAIQELKGKDAVIEKGEQGTLFTIQLLVLVCIPTTTRACGRLG